MDPHANLREQRATAHALVAEFDHPPADPERVAELAEKLADLVLSLDDWRLRGGFDPYAQTSVAQPPRRGA